jgi:hypothetical protein
MNKSKNQVTNHRFPVLLGLLLGFSLVLMIPISDNVLAKPVFDGSSVGIGCSQTYNEVMKLRAKKAREGLTQAEASQLGAAESNYNDICAGIYGPLSREVPDTKIPRIPLGENAGVIHEMQPQNDQNPPVIDNEGVATDEQQQQPLNNPKSQGPVLDGNISNVIE